MRLGLAGIVVVLLGHAAAAQSVFGDYEVKILDWGFSNRRIIGRAPAPGTASGVMNRVDPADQTPLRRAEAIEVCLGTQIGVVHRLERLGDTALVPGLPGWLSVPIESEWTHPPTTPPGGRATTVERTPNAATREPRYSGWTFEHPYELVPGRWTLTLRDGERVLDWKGFDVSISPDCERPVS